MVKYRIKIITFNDGRKTYIPQRKRSLFSWKGISCKGETFLSIDFHYKSMNLALEVIDLNYKDSNGIHQIEFEYINKYTKICNQ